MVKSGPVWRLIGAQLGVTLLLTMFAMIWFGRLGTQSVLLGGVVCILPSAYAAKKLFQYQGARAAKQIVRGFYRGEALKIGLSIVLFSLVFIFFNIIPWIFFGAYIGIQLSVLLAPVVFIKG